MKEYNSEKCIRLCEDWEIVNYFYTPQKMWDERNQAPKCIPYCRPQFVDKDDPEWAHLQACPEPCLQGQIWNPSEGACVLECICNPHGIVNPWLVSEDMTKHDTPYESGYSCIHKCNPHSVLVKKIPGPGYECKQKCKVGEQINNRFSYLKQPDGSYMDAACIKIEDDMKFASTDNFMDTFTFPGVNPNIQNTITPDQIAIDSEDIVIPPNNKMFMSESGTYSYWLDIRISKNTEPQFYFVDAKSKSDIPDSKGWNNFLCDIYDTTK